MTSRRPRLTSLLPAHRSVLVGEFAGEGGARPHGSEASPVVVHPHASVALMLRGRSTVWCGSTHQLEAGHVLIVPEGAPHYAISREYHEMLGMAVCTSCLESSPAGQRLAQIFTEVADGASAQRVLDPAAAERLRWTLDGLRHELAEARPDQSLAVEGHLALIATTLSRAAVAAQIVPGDRAGVSLSARALSFIVRNATARISLADVAEHVHRSAAHTAAVVKRDTGQTVVDWITNARLAAARDLLLRTDDTVDVVANRVGFASASHFHRTFRRHHDATPAAWRRMHTRPSGARG